VARKRVPDPTPEPEDFTPPENPVTGRTPEAQAEWDADREAERESEREAAALLAQEPGQPGPGAPDVRTSPKVPRVEPDDETVRVDPSGDPGP
jgi:hypothetical protein